MAHSSTRLVMASLVAVALCLVIYYFSMSVLSHASLPTPVAFQDELVKGPVADRGLQIKISSLESIVRGAFFAISARLTNDNQVAVEFDLKASSFSLLVSKGGNPEAEVALPGLSGTNPRLFPTELPARDKRLSAPQALISFDAREALAGLGKGSFVVRLKVSLRLSDGSTAQLVSNSIRVVVPESSAQ
ncbi:MAG: hypothetical protein WC712_07655 [Candidatus Brocadiia bacterium]